MTLIHQSHLLDSHYLGHDAVASRDGTLNTFQVYSLTDHYGTDYRWIAEGEAFSNGGYTSAREAHRAACLVLTGQNEPEGCDAE